mmetsp:Transcript_67292/g.146662  ORF Transcript_67292/g.146662 Transcript_67292/m.146662 type:complete len:372 (-) Transcript_67292:172-1287(-)|eukprot:CAMPEP_0170585484 /NCGR_PEP_ID=MMETSP0224-20130122/9239_1 /TAXON_ID=285029 /ORGANISM="Togula jolla, Strain CCCM 725" /LENGTH=371 /DNA_ID=CAMNT_0010908973 /DNA_START=56 /DNA_END=1171 /DNA_ORIENTATION=+
MTLVAKNNFDMDGSDVEHVVVVRYFLDRPTTSLETGTCIFWKKAPAQCDGARLAQFFRDSGIITDGYFAQVYMEKFGAYMSVEAMSGMGYFDFSKATGKNPARIDVRITDLHDDHHGGKKGHHIQASNAPLHCNMGPVGLTAFAYLVAFAAASRVSGLVDDSVEASWRNSWATYAFFGGVLEFIVAMWEVTRNNIYGATVFSIFGTSWMATGLKMILVQTKAMKGGHTPGGDAVKEVFLFLFTMVMWKLTLKMNRVSNTIISTLAVLLLLGAFGGFYDEAKWAQNFVAIFLCPFAFYGYMAQITNEVFQKVVFPTYPFAKHSQSIGVNDAAGLGNVLKPNIARLRSIGSFEDKHHHHHDPSQSPHADRTPK